MITMSLFTAGLLAMIMALWLIAAIWTTIAGLRRISGARAAKAEAARFAALLGGSPALPMVVAPDGRIDASERLADWLGLKRLPEHIGALAGGEGGLVP